MSITLAWNFNLLFIGPLFELMGNDSGLFFSPEQSMEPSDRNPLSLTFASDFPFNYQTIFWQLILIAARVRNLCWSMLWLFVFVKPAESKANYLGNSLKSHQRLSTPLRGKHDRFRRRFNATLLIIATLFVSNLMSVCLGPFFIEIRSWDSSNSTPKRAISLGSCLRIDSKIELGVGTFEKYIMP